MTSMKHKTFGLYHYFCFLGHVAVFTWTPCCLHVLHMIIVAHAFSHLGSLCFSTVLCHNHGDRGSVSHRHCSGSTVPPSWPGWRTHASVGQWLLLIHCPVTCLFVYRLPRQPPLRPTAGKSDKTLWTNLSFWLLVLLLVAVSSMCRFCFYKLWKCQQRVQWHIKPMKSSCI